jgi:hypothetical protein
MMSCKYESGFICIGSVLPLETTETRRNRASGVVDP